MPQAEQAIPAEFGQDGAECLAHSDGDLPVMDDIHRVHPRAIRRSPGGVPHENLGVALERFGLLFAVGRADMLENPLTRLPLVSVGLLMT